MKSLFKLTSLLLLIFALNSCSKSNEEKLSNQNQIKSIILDGVKLSHKKTKYITTFNVRISNRGEGYRITEITDFTNNCPIIQKNGLDKVFEYKFNNRATTQDMEDKIQGGYVCIIDWDNNGEMVDVAVEQTY